MRSHAMLSAVVILFVAMGLVGGGDGKDEVKKDLAALKGVWTIASAQKDGKKLTEEQLKGVTLTVAGEKVLVQNADKVLFEGTLHIDPTKKPKVIDVTQTSEGELKGKTIPGIYELDGDTLKVCSGKERPTEFSSKEGSGQFLRVYKREKK